MKFAREATGRNGRKNIGSETVGLVTSLPPRGSFTMYFCVGVGLVGARMRRFEADGNLHKRPFRIARSYPLVDVSIPAAHIRMHRGNTSTPRALGSRVGRVWSMIWLLVWGSSLDTLATAKLATVTAAGTVVATRFGSGTGLFVRHTHGRRAERFVRIARGEGREGPRFAADTLPDKHLHRYPPLSLWPRATCWASSLV